MCPENKLLSQVRKILATSVQAVRDSECMFAPTETAAIHNSAVLERHGFNYTNVMRAQQGSIVWYGSEFRSWKLLKKICHTHEFWPHMRPVLSGGGSFPLKEIDDTSRREDNEWNLQRGNHKSGKAQIRKMRDMVHDEVNRGFSLPPPKTDLNKLLRCSLAPFGMVDQGYITETG
jgi:hypothetical protein